jgi:hypothetical protein
MNFINIPKNIPKRKYLVIDETESSWSNSRHKGIHELEIDGEFIITDTSNNSSDRYCPIQISQVMNKELNSVGVNHVLHVIKSLNDSPNIGNYLNSDEFKVYKRGNEIESILEK